jgi:hypothetical protein
VSQRTRTNAIPLRVFVIVASLGAGATAVTYIRPRVLGISLLVTSLWIWPLVFDSWLNGFDKAGEQAPRTYFETSSVVVLAVIAPFAVELGTATAVGILLVVSLYPLAFPPRRVIAGVASVRPWWYLAAGVVCGLAGALAHDTSAAVIAMFAAFGVLGQALGCARFAPARVTD